MRTIVLVLVTACGGGGGDDMVDRHAPGTCDSVWTANGYDQCEAGCVDSSIALNATGPACTAKTAAGTSANCSATFAYDGFTGCCVSDTPRLYFADCQ